MIRRVEDVIGEVVIRYEGDMGTLALNLNIEIDVTEEELEKLQNLVTEINEIIIPAINRKALENEKQKAEYFMDKEHNVIYKNIEE